MRLLRLSLAPLTAFGTPLAGDTFFGQLCWTLRRLYGNPRLNALLDGYTAGHPFAVVSDALPQGFIPLPSLPGSFWSPSSGERKALKKKRWVPLADVHTPLAAWRDLASNDAEMAEAIVGHGQAVQTERAQPHNTLNRRTGSTGEGQFAPYAMAQRWFHPAMRFDLYIVLDDDRLTREELVSALDVMGQTGFGRDASIGLGKFSCLGAPQEHSFAGAETPASSAPGDSWLTLGPCAPQGLGYCPQRSFYQTVTRFGRHGDVAVQSGNPFKRPLLLARAGAVFRPEQMDPQQRFIGQGIGGVSEAMPETVHQGYAPVVPICVEATA